MYRVLEWEIERRGFWEFGVWSLELEFVCLFGLFFFFLPSYGEETAPRHLCIRFVSASYHAPISPLLCSALLQPIMM